jgi:hypothetical protein
MTENKTKNTGECIPPEVVHETQRALDSILALLEPYADPSIPENLVQSDYLFACERTRDFVQKSFSSAMKNPGLIPPFMDMNHLEADFSGAVNIGTLCGRAKLLLNYIEHINASTRNETIHTALTLYHSIKLAAARFIPGAREALDELDSGFSSGG